MMEMSNFNKSPTPCMQLNTHINKQNVFFVQVFFNGQAKYVPVIGGWYVHTQAAGQKSSQ